MEIEKIKHEHQWIRTGAMEIGKYRCIECGMWGKEYDEQKEQLIEKDAEIANLKALHQFTIEACNQNRDVRDAEIARLREALEKLLKSEDCSIGLAEHEIIYSALAK